jgi:hypothetical protein
MLLALGSCLGTISLCPAWSDNSEPTNNRIVKKLRSEEGQEKKRNKELLMYCSIISKINNNNIC